MTLALKHKKKNKSICAFCGYSLTKRALHIHHIDGNHQNNHEKNLVIVCANCHAEAHEKQQMRKMNLTLPEPISKKKKEPFEITKAEELKFKETFPQHYGFLKECIDGGSFKVTKEEDEYFRKNHPIHHIVLQELYKNGEAVLV